MGTKTVVETKKTVEIKSITDFRRLLKPVTIFVAIISVIIAAFIISPSNLAVGVITVVSYGILGLFIQQTIYAIFLLRNFL